MRGFPWFTCASARPLRVAVLFGLAAVAFAAAPSGAHASHATLSPKLVPSEGVLMGVVARPRETRTRSEELRFLESRLGRRVDIDHDWVPWNAAFPRAYHKWTMAAGRIPLIAWGSKRRDGTPVSWASIASGAHDAWIRERADAVKALGRPIMLTYHHEPENDWQLHGTAADYVAAWRHVVDVFRNRGATNVVWVWNIMAYTFHPASEQNPNAWYPGDAYVDWIAADGYSWYPCITTTSWRSFKQIFSYFYDWGTAHGKPLMAPEFGVSEDTVTPDPLRKARWFAQTRADIKTWPKLKAIVYYNSDTDCPWWFDSTPAALDAFKTFANDSYYNPRHSALDTTAPTVSVTSPANGSTAARSSQVTISASASDNVGVWKVEFRVNGSLKCTDATAPYACTWYVGSAPGTSNSIEARAYDASGNSTSRTVYAKTS